MSAISFDEWTKSHGFSPPLGLFFSQEKASTVWVKVLHNLPLRQYIRLMSPAAAPGETDDAPGDGGGGRGQAASGESSACRLGRPGTKPKHSAGSAHHVAPEMDVKNATQINIALRKARGHSATQEPSPMMYRCDDIWGANESKQRPVQFARVATRVMTTRPVSSSETGGRVISRSPQGGYRYPSLLPVLWRAGRHGKPVTPPVSRGQIGGP